MAQWQRAGLITLRSWVRFLVSETNTTQLDWIELITLSQGESPNSSYLFYLFTYFIYLLYLFTLFIYFIYLLYLSTLFIYFIYLLYLSTLFIYFIYLLYLFTFIYSSNFIIYILFICSIIDFNSIQTLIFVYRDDCYSIRQYNVKLNNQLVTKYFFIFTNIFYNLIYETKKIEKLNF